MYRWTDYDSIWANLVRRVLVEDGNDLAYFAVVDRLRGGDGWEVVMPSGLDASPHPDLESAELAAEAALGIDPSEVAR